MALPKDTQVWSLLGARVRLALSSLPLPLPVLSTFALPHLGKNVVCPANS